jgi:hypothetical protein
MEMIDLAVASLMARDLTERQFAESPRPGRAPAAAPRSVRRAPVRRASARLLRVLADRVEPAPRRAFQA